MPSLKYYNGSAWVSIDPEVTVGTAKAKLAIEVVGAGKLRTYYPHVELSDGSLNDGTTKYYRDKIVKGSKTFNLPSPVSNSTTLAVTSDIKHVYKHTCTVRIGYYPFAIIFYNTSNSSTSLYNIMLHASGKVLECLYSIGEMLGVASVYTSSGVVKVTGDHYYKNGSNYMLRESWSGYDVTLDQEAIEEV